MEDLNERPELRDALIDQLKALPDLERAISRVHAGMATILQFVSVLEAFLRIWVSTSLPHHLDVFISNNRVRHHRKHGTNTSRRRFLTASRASGCRRSQ